MAAPDTRAALLDTAQELVQTGGFNWFSYRDLADRIGIRTASIHYHFPTKTDLGVALMQRYHERFLALLAAIEQERKSARGRLEAFAGLFRETLESGERLCLCGMLATEFATLPAELQREVTRFFEHTEAWLARILAEGQGSGESAFEGPPTAVARTVFSALEGAMIAARAFGDTGRLVATGEWLVNTLCPE
jgi:TetR/AcrR family transcriptional repressor of nem operon